MHYLVPIYWRMTESIIVEASSKKEAIGIAEGHSIAHRGEYVTESFEVDEDEIILLKTHNLPKRTMGNKTNSMAVSLSDELYRCNNAINGIREHLTTVMDTIEKEKDVQVEKNGASAPTDKMQENADNINSAIKDLKIAYNTLYQLLIH